VSGEVRDHFETVDGSRPEALALSEQSGRRFPLHAFALLDQGDAFEAAHAAPPKDGPARARQYAEDRIELRAHRAPAAQVERVRVDVTRQLSGNLALLGRMHSARPISVDLVPPGKALSAYGYPKAASPGAAGLFWDKPEWPAARIALRQEQLERGPQLVFHELAHAIHYLAFTEAERAALYRFLVPTYRTRAAADEVFAIYTEREFLPEFSEADFRAPGVYGRTRARWSEDHLFTRFVRSLYFPHKPLAGPRLFGGR
jgi:hypothetical protein